MRAAVTGDPGGTILAQRYRYPPGQNLGGRLGETTWQRMAKTQILEQGGTIPSIGIRTEDGLPLMIDYVTKQNGEILFVLHEGIKTTHYTQIELEHILSNPNALSRTKFIIDWYY